MLVLLTFGGGGGGVVQNRESPDFRSPEVGRYGLLWAACTLSIYLSNFFLCYLMFFLLLNCCCCCKHSTLTDITHMEDSLFFYIPAKI